MIRISPEEKYIDCRLCGTIIGSSRPTCQKCGLETSPEGIEELAEIEEQIFRAISDANSLKMIAFVCLFFSAVNIFYYFAVDSQSVWFNVPLWVGYVYFIALFIRWHRNYSKDLFNNYDLERVQKEKRNALFLILCSMILGFGLTILLR